MSHATETLCSAARSRSSRSCSRLIVAVTLTPRSRERRDVRAMFSLCSKLLHRDAIVNDSIQLKNSLTLGGVSAILHALLARNSGEKGAWARRRRADRRAGSPIPRPVNRAVAVRGSKASPNFLVALRSCRLGCEPAIVCRLGRLENLFYELGARIEGPAGCAVAGALGSGLNPLAVRAGYRRDNSK